MKILFGILIDNINHKYKFNFKNYRRKKYDTCKKKSKLVAKRF